MGDVRQRLGIREITASTGFGSGALSLAHFGLGREAVVDVRIRYPRAGGKDPVFLRAVAADRLVEVAAAGPCDG